MESVFDLRLKLHGRPFNLKKRIADYTKSGMLRKEISYVLQYNLVSSEERHAVLTLISECMGQRIGQFEIWLGKAWMEVETISSLLQEIQIKSLYLTLRILTKPFANQLISLTKTHGIYEIHLDVLGGDSDLDTVSMLLELSKHVPSMIINPVAPYIFGALDVEWGPIILKMFSNKLDTLRICNLGREHLISKYSAD
ncbi:hypothetical protein PMAYCL1PPCAC_31796, partial [Pristionchus mayeri]